MHRAFADEDGLCRRSSWPHHVIRPAQPSSLRSHFLCLRLRSSQRVWSFPRALHPRQSIPFFCCSGVEFFIIFSNSGPEAIYSTMNFFIGSPLVKLHFDLAISCPKES